MSSVVVIGGGIVGLSCAYHCLRRGHKVTVLDEGASPHTGCSSGNSGLIVPSHFVPLASPGLLKLGLKLMLNPKAPFGFRDPLDPELAAWAWKFLRAATPEHGRRAATTLRDLNLLSKREHKALAEIIPDGYLEKGLLMLCQTEEELYEEAELLEPAHQLGLRARILSREEARDVNPGVTSKAWGGVIFDDDAHISPPVLLAGLESEILKLGGSIHHGIKVTDFEMARGDVQAAMTSDGSFPGDQFVLAGGIWSPEISKKLGQTLPMAAGSGCSFTLEAPPQQFTVPAILIAARVAITPIGNALRFGGLMEVGASYGKVSPRRIEGMKEAIAEALPAFTSEVFAGQEVWHGMRPCSPDGVPYIGRLREQPNVICACGHAMMGLSMGPGTGHLVASLASGEQPEIDLAMCRPSRFSHAA